jgi:hypothetical protein
MVGERRRGSCPAALERELVPWLHQVWAHPEAWQQQFFDHLLGAYKGGIAHAKEQTSPLANLFAHIGEIGKPPYVVTLAMVAGCVLAAREKSARARVPVLFAASSLLALLPTETFVRLVVAFIYAGGCIGWAWTLQRSSRRQLCIAYGIAALLLVVPLSAHTLLMHVRTTSARDSTELPLRTLIAQRVPRGALVIAPPVAYFALKAHGVEQLYPNALHDLRYVRSRRDRSAHRAYLLRRRPGFLLLEANVEPHSLSALEGQATFTLLGAATNPVARPAPRRDKYDLRLYGVTYPE